MKIAYYILTQIIAIAIMFAVAIFGLVGCAAQKPINQTRDSVRVEYRRDSIYVYERDSIFRDRWRAGDTVFVTVENWKIRYKDNTKEVHDTVTVAEQKEVPVEYTPEYYKRTSAGFWVLLSLIVFVVGWRLFKRFYLRM